MKQAHTQGLVSLLIVPVLGLVRAANAHDPVVAVSDPDALFHSRDPALDANKQVVYHIIKDLLEANHWELAPQYITERYVQHNPLAASGLEGLLRFFREVVNAKPTPIPDRLQRAQIVAVTAEADLVTVMTVREVPGKEPGQASYTTTWFDTWRIRDGKADEHWDPATR